MKRKFLVYLHLGLTITGAIVSCPFLILADVIEDKVRYLDSKQLENNGSAIR